MGRGAVVAVSKSANAPSPSRRAIAAMERIVLARTMSPRKYAAQVLNVLGLVGTGDDQRCVSQVQGDNEARAPSRSQHDLDVDAVRDLDAHQLPQLALVSIEADEASVAP